MATKTVTNIDTLKINYLSQADYDAEKSAGTLEPDELYLTPSSNGGASAFTAEFGTTTYADVKDAYDNDAILICTVDDSGNTVVLQLVYFDATNEIFYFAQPNGDGWYWTELSNANGWDDGTRYLASTDVATQLADGLMSALDKQKLDGLSNRNIWYGTCSTNSSSSPKVVTTASGDFSLTTGNMLVVKFSNTNSLSSASLQVDGGTSKSVYQLDGTSDISYRWGSGEVVMFAYDGTKFILLDQSTASTTAYGITKLNNTTSSTSTSEAATANAVKNAYDHGGVTSVNGSTGAVSLSIHNVPSGGTSGQVLSKASGTDYDLAWATPSSGSVTDVEVNGTSVVTDGVAEVTVPEEVFLATYGTTTSAEIEAAYQAGKLVIVASGDKVYSSMHRSSATEFTFSAIYSDIEYRVTCDNDVWSSNLLYIATTPYSVGKMIPFLACSTAAGTAAKTTSNEGTYILPDTLVKGIAVIVKFTNSNTVASPTLKVGDYAAKSIKRYGTTAPSTSAKTSWKAGACILFVYDGTYWQMCDWLNDDTLYSEISTANITDGTASTTGLITGRRAKAAVEAFAPVTSVNGNTGAVTVTVPTKLSDLTDDISTATPTASTVSKFDASAHMNSADMSAQDVSDFVDSLNIQSRATGMVEFKTLLWTNTQGEQTSYSIPVDTSEYDYLDVEITRYGNTQTARIPTTETSGEIYAMYDSYQTARAYTLSSTALNFANGAYFTGYASYTKAYGNVYCVPSKVYGVKNVEV